MKDNSLENLGCGAVLKGTWIQLGQGGRKIVEQIGEADMLLASHEVKIKVRNVWKHLESTYYVIQAANGAHLSVTGEQCLLTKQGWKRARRLTEGDELLCYTLEEGRRFYRLDSIRKMQQEENCFYSIAFGGRAYIANGFICCDYDMQHGG